MSLLICIIAAFILLEAREVYQGMLSMPMITSLFLIMLGLPAKPVLLLAILVQLHFVNTIPAGAVKFPEYQYAYFIITGLFVHEFSFLFIDIPYFMIVLLFFIIIFYSKFISQFVYLKRILLGKYFSSAQISGIKSVKKVGYGAFILSIFTVFIISVVLFLVLILAKIFFKIDSLLFCLDILKEHKEIFNISFYTLFLYEFFKFVFYKKEKWPFITGIIFTLLFVIIYFLKFWN